ncbi:MAG: T9SS type A sorting domain-containing protein [Rhodothermales bacterium]
MALLLSAGAAQGQIIRDTLDHRRYFPLAVGNEWQYEGHGFASAIPFYERKRVVADTLVGDRRYFRYVVEGFDHSMVLIRTHTAWLRYNAAGAVVAFADPGEDTMAIDSTLFWYHKDFGDSVDAEFGARAIVEGRYDTTVFIGTTVVPVAAVKYLGERVPFVPFVSEVIAAGFGLVSYQYWDGDEAGLTYARIDGRTYGVPAIHVGYEQPAHPLPATHILSLFPMPAGETVTIGYALRADHGATIDVIDLLGRTLITGPISAGSASLSEKSIDVSPLRGGTYLVRLTDDAGHADTAVLIKR